MPTARPPPPAAGWLAPLARTFGDAGDPPENFAMLQGFQLAQAGRCAGGQPVRLPRFGYATTLNLWVHLFGGGVASQRVSE